MRNFGYLLRGLLVEKTEAISEKIGMQQTMDDSFVDLHKSKCQLTSGYKMK